MTEAEFRALYPEFTSAAAYPPEQINNLLGIATARLKPELWVDTLTQGIGLFVAHFLTMADRAKSGGSTPGGLATSKTIGPVTVSYDPAYTAIEGAGHWNQSAYGQQFAYYSRLVGRCAPSQFFGA